MKHYTIYTTAGIVAHNHAECFEKTPGEVVFYVGDKVVDRYPRHHVIVVHPSIDKDWEQHLYHGHGREE